MPFNIPNRLRRLSSSGRQGSPAPPSSSAQIIRDPLSPQPVPDRVAEQNQKAHTAAAEPQPAHPPINGSCLCETIQYEVRFPGPESWPPKRNSCHCPQCRHMSGALVVHLITVPSTNLCIYDPTLSLREYSSSSFARRAFCCQCGSSLFWRHVPTDDETLGRVSSNISRMVSTSAPEQPSFLGRRRSNTVGMEVGSPRHRSGLLGGIREEGKTTQVGAGEYASDEGIDIFIGTLSERWLKGEDGKVLATSVDGVLWAGDAVPGVTDFRAVGEGERFLKGRDTDVI
ncbi:hypothetical protein EX30DRAFT_339990 [Ascodesmis nigricans]|uniref:CENP-V/GFA domain-containing protein n=1 Tax=Ascodesmis nigricans TaxID=341454 RepID=A0A4S2MZ63_9PEZI|nr:hypothetical protein EX30DRAFT_339990 [Ascodesmis nigricans]